MIRITFTATPDDEIEEGNLAEVNYEFMIDSGGTHASITEHYIYFLRALGYILDGPADLRGWSYAETEEDD